MFKIITFLLLLVVLSLSSCMPMREKRIIRAHEASVDTSVYGLSKTQLSKPWLRPFTPADYEYELSGSDSSAWDTSYLNPLPNRGYLIQSNPYGAIITPLNGDPATVIYYDN